MPKGVGGRGGALLRHKMRNVKVHLDWISPPYRRWPVPGKTTHIFFVKVADLGTDVWW